MAVVPAKSSSSFDFVGDPSNSFAPAARGKDFIDKARSN